MKRTLSARATVVQLYNYDAVSFMLLIQHQQIYIGLPSSIRYDHADSYALPLGVLKIYEDLSHPQYFFMYFSYEPKINISSSPQHCPHVSLVLSKGQFFFHQ
jgi:hypothetical protein